MSVFAFALTSHKNVLFNTALSVLVFWLYKSANRFIIVAAAGAIVCVVISIIDFYFLLQDPGTPSVTGNFGSLFGRRSLIIPAFVNFLWVDFFSQHDLLYWAESKLTMGLIDSPYELSSPEVIGSFYFGAKTYANCSWVGSGFGNAGLLGVILDSILLGLFISYLNTATKKIPEGFVVATSLIVLLTLVRDADIITSLFTTACYFL